MCQIPDPDAEGSRPWQEIGPRTRPARDVHPQQVTEAASRFNQLAPAKATLRPRVEILRFFDGLELLEPGLVQVHRWRPGLAAPGHNEQAACYCGLARKA